VTIDTIAAAAGVGRQTIYRWWPSKGAVLLDAMAARASRAAPDVDTGSLAGDLSAFLVATFRGVREPANRARLRRVMAEAQRDPHAAGLLRDFTARRRAELRALLDRAAARGELSAGADVELAVDQAYGVLWYRLLLDHAPLTRAAAERLAGALHTQLTG